MEVEEDITAHTPNTKDTPACEKEGASTQVVDADPTSSKDPPVEATGSSAAAGGRKRSASDLSDCSTSSSAKLSSAPKKRVALRHMLSTASDDDDDDDDEGQGRRKNDEGCGNLDEKPPSKEPKEMTTGEKVNITMSEVQAIGRKRSGSSQTNPVVVRPLPPDDTELSNGLMDGPTWDPSPPSCGDEGEQKISAAEGSAASSSGAYFANEATMAMPMTTTMTMDQPAATWDEEQCTPESPTPIQVVVCQTVGTGIASLDLHNTLQQDQPHRKNVAMEEAATDAIRDALAKTSLHLNYTEAANQDSTRNQAQGRTIAIQLGVPDLGIGGSSIDVSAACSPMWRPEQVSITSGIGGMYIDPAEPSQSAPSASAKGHVIVVASVTISEEQNDATAASTAASSLQMLSEAAPSPPTNDLPSRIELQRRLHQAESIIENLLTETQRQRTSYQQEGLQKIDPVLPGAASSMAAPPSRKGQSQVTPTGADMDPDIEVRTYSSKVPSLHVNNPWNNQLSSPNDNEEEEEEEVPAQSSSGRVSASSSTSSSTGSFAIAAPSAVQYPHTAVVAAGSAAASHIKLDQLVQIMDQEEQKNVKHNYHDYASLSDAFLKESRSAFEKSQTDLMLMSKRNVCFPVKIMILIEDCHRRGLTNIVSWNSSGRAFRVYDHVRFENEILPLYLESSKYSSFLRQLNLYSFRRFAGGMEKGNYYHDR